MLANKYIVQNLGRGRELPKANIFISSQQAETPWYGALCYSSSPGASAYQHRVQFTLILFIPPNLCVDQLHSTFLLDNVCCCCLFVWFYFLMMFLHLFFSW